MAEPAGSAATATPRHQRGEPRPVGSDTERSGGLDSSWLSGHAHLSVASAIDGGETGGLGP